MNRHVRRLASFLVLTCLALTLTAEEVWHEDEGWGLNLPEGWVIMDSRSDIGNLNFSDPLGHGILQIFGVTGSAREFVAGLQSTMKTKPVPGSATGSGIDFLFNKRDSFLVEASWKAGTIPVRGYLMAINAPAGAIPAMKGAAKAPEDKPSAWVLVCFAVESEWSNYGLQLLSVLDSFFIGDDAKYLPGAISQCDAGDGWSGGPVINLELSISAAQAVADREASILATYQKAEPEAQNAAWRRFYQMLWKDNYARLDDVAMQIAALFKKQAVPRERQVQELLSWVQSFAPETYTSLADLRVPIDAVSQKRGDCDGRGLVYMILLEHMGFSSILMVSSVYKHSMVGVDYQQAGIKAGGATFPIDQKNWMVAETMTPVALGKIGQDVADPKNWIGFDLHFKP